ncbi:MAG: type II secretion system protein [Lachnospiraceae bacterium]|nr:type II secretion system protein [Lachnospiraceae bacterium]MBQ8666466.1 type II secretion system protein [Lachnospiraceae bacterium]
MNKKEMNNKGFSLVELIIVIAIMAILVGALAPQFMKYIERSRQATDIQAAGTVFTVLTTAYADPDVTEADKPSGTYTLPTGPSTTNEYDNEVWESLGQKSPVLKSNAYKAGGFTITLDANGNFSVKLTSATTGVPSKIVDASGSHDDTTTGGSGS